MSRKHNNHRAVIGNTTAIAATSDVTELAVAHTALKGNNHNKEGSCTCSDCAKDNNSYKKESPSCAFSCDI